jgi:hypothetical protein
MESDAARPRSLLVQSETDSPPHLAAEFSRAGIAYRAGRGAIWAYRLTHAVPASALLSNTGPQASSGASGELGPIASSTRCPRV